VTLLRVTVIGPELPIGILERRSAAICFCGRGMSAQVCLDCGYVRPAHRPVLAFLDELERDPLLEAIEESLDTARGR
jgi:hypothetical protein